MPISHKLFTLSLFEILIVNHLSINVSKFCISKIYLKRKYKIEIEN